MKYWAFISYSHRDKPWGDWLHKALESYRIPRPLVGKATVRGEPVPARVYPVFRDREELPTAVDLGAVITSALDQSRYLLVICSPNSARSQWVNQEIINFKRLGRENRVLAIIVAGEPNAADGKPGFSPADECFPPALKFKLGPDGNLSSERTEPIAADARDNKDGKPNALLKLLAGVLGVNYDDLKRRDEAARRRRLRALLALTTSLTLVFAALAATAVWQWRVATERRLVAETRLYQSSIALASGSLQAGRVTAGRDALWRAPAALRNWEWGWLARQLYPTLASFPIHAGRIDPLGSWHGATGERWAILTSNGLLCARWIPGQGFALNTLPQAAGARVDVSTDGRRALICADGVVTLWDCDSAKLLATLTGENEPAWTSAYFLDTAGTRWLASSEDNWRVRNLADGTVLGEISTDGFKPEKILARSRDGLALAFSPLGGTAGLLDSTGRWLAPLDSEAATNGCDFAAFSPDERHAVLLAGDGGVWLLDRQAASTSWRQLRPQEEDLSARNRLPSHAAFTPDGKSLWFVSRQKLYIHDLTSGELHERPISDGFTPARLAATNDLVAIGTEQGHVFFFRTESLRPVASGLAHDGRVIDIAALPADSTNPARWVSAGEDGTLQLWPTPQLVTTTPFLGQPGFPAVNTTSDERRDALATRLGPSLDVVKKAHQGNLHTLALNPAGNRLASGGLDGLVRIWSLPDLEPLLAFHGPGEWMQDIHFSSDPLRLGLHGENFGANAFSLFSIPTALDWKNHPWSPDSTDISPAAESAAFADWQRHTVLR